MTEASLINGLTYAEIMQSSMDIVGEPNIPESLGQQEIITRLRGRYVNEVEAYSEQLVQFDTAGTHFEEDEAVYEKLRLNHNAEGPDTWIKPHRIGRIVLGAAGGHMGTIRHELYASRDTCLAAGEELSRTMADYIRKHLPGTDCIQINGQAYYLNEGYLTKRIPKDKLPNNRWLYTVFGTSETTRQFNTKYDTPDKTRKLFAKIADTKDWHNLLENLQKASQF